MFTLPHGKILPVLITAAYGYYVSLFRPCCLSLKTSMGLNSCCQLSPSWQMQDDFWFYSPCALKFSFQNTILNWPWQEPGANSDQTHCITHCAVPVFLPQSRKAQHFDAHSSAVGSIKLEMGLISNTKLAPFSLLQCDPATSRSHFATWLSSPAAHFMMFHAGSACLAIYQS